MDNQLFPGGGAFLDDVAQVCPLCGMMFNNTLTYQHHMQLHILSANAMLGNQPPPDPGIGMPTPASILDLMGGVSQHALSTGSGVPLVPPQAVFSGAAASMTPHMISPGVGLVTGPLPNMGLPQQPSGRAKEKKQKSQSVKSTSISSNTNTTPSAQAPSGSGTFKSHESSSSTYISTFPKDLQKMEHISQKPQNAQHSQNKIPSDVFPSTAPQLDPLEALIFTSPVKTSAPGFDRQLSRKSTGSPQDSGITISKESKKLFQPFVSADTTVTAGFVTKANTLYPSDSLLSPVKSGTSKAPLLDVLSTPQKISYHSNNENLLTSPPTLPNTSSGEVRHFGMFQDSEVASVPIERKLDLPTKISSQDHDKVPSKSQYFPDIMDPLNISPKAGSVRKKDIDSLIKMPVHQGSLDHSSSSSPVPRPTLPSEFATFRADSARTMVSPKVSPAVPSGILDSDSTSLSSKPHMFGGAAAAAEVLPTAGVPSSTPPVFGSSVTNAGGHSSLASPAIDITLGTGYFNALTQKFINPTFSLGGDFNKPGTSGTAGDPDGQKQKIYFENGVIMNQDYDKISDTNDEDNLERLIDDIDTKSEPIIDKGYSEIEDLLNEFNEKQEDMKNKSQLDDFMKTEDFLKNVIEDTSKSKIDTSIKVDEPAFNPPEEFEMNKSIITDILEQEKERIEKESTELENARLSSLINTSSVTSSSVTVSSSTATSTVTSVSNTEPKVSTSADSEEKKEDDHVDFEIPKVGKLMKIRKYFQIQEQKRKEQTEKVTEIRVHEKTEAPPAEDKPQTILVQVSKRKKIEYGPYLNRQSLLEGKPKANIETTSPPKTYRPKPKPPVPEKRTFNLRERKTKTDFATLATTGSRTAETKKTDTKQKESENTEKNKSEKEVIEEVKDEKSEEKIEESVSKDVKIVTRNQEKKKEIESQVDKTKSKAIKVSPKSNSESVKDKDNENETKQKDLKAALRTRSARTEAENADGKNLRKRTIKSTAAGDVSGSKVKIKKSGESVQKVNTDSVQKANTESEEKVTRSKSKIKTTPEKSGIKKCSVNLGEKYNETKAKSLIDKSDNKEGNTANVPGKCLTQELVSKMDVEDYDNQSNTLELKSNAAEKDESKKSCVKEKEQTDNLERMETSEGSAGIADEDQKSKKEEKLTNVSEPKVTEQVDKKENEKVQLKEGNSTSQKVGRKGNKSRHERSNRKESNIFEKIDQTECSTKKRLSNITDESQMVSITSTDNTDKKVTMKLKLGPNFQKAFELFNPKKRKHEAISESGQTLEKETKKEQKIEKKFKDFGETEKFEDSKSEIFVEKESKKEQKVEKKHRKAIETGRFKDSKLEISDEKETKKEQKIDKTFKDDGESDRLKDSIPEISVEKETKMEQKTEKKLKNAGKTDRSKDAKPEISAEKEAEKELKIEKKLKDAGETDKFKDFIPDVFVENETVKEQKIEKKFKDSGKMYRVKDSEIEISVENATECSMKLNDTIENAIVQNSGVEKNFSDENNKDTSELEAKSTDLDNSSKINIENNENTGQHVSEKEIKQAIEMDLNKEIKEEKVVKKVKHSVENEFQRLVNEAMAEAQKEGETAKSKNLRKRINENVKYNVDESDDELDRIKMLQEEFFISSKGHKTTPKGNKIQGKGQGSKGKSKLEITGTKDIDTAKQQQAKKDVDVYDFTDTEMSDTEERTPKKLGFKPKYVSNLNLFGQKKLPFVSKPMSPVESLKSDNHVESLPEAVTEIAPSNDSENENADTSISYVGKTVEPLKIKLTKIIPFKEKKHKHKKKKRKREKERKEDDIEKIDSESRDSVESGVAKKNEDGAVLKSEVVCESENFEIKKIDEVKSVDSIGQESNSNSNEGEDEPAESGNSTRSNRRTKLKEKKHICEYCNVGFGQKCDLRRHVMIHTGERPYPCQICDKRFQRKTDLVKHTRTHTGEKPYACEFCDKRVSDKSQLNVHRRLHTGDRPYCCSKCGKRCITSSELSRHMAHCSEKMVERCSLCKKAFTIKECLGMHMKLHYRSRGKSFKCEKCVIGFDKKTDLDNHHCVDPISYVYVCSECYEEFCDEMLYAEHIKAHDLGVLACNVCTNIFEDKHSLETHMCGMGVEKQKQLACEICETEFQDQDLLNQHVASHDNDEGTFMCDFCSDIFKVRKQLIEHSKQHDVVMGPSVGNSPRTPTTSVASSQITETGQSLTDVVLNNVEIESRKETEKFTTIKQEVDSNDFQFLSAGRENLLNTKENARNVKSEMFGVIPGLPSNRSRASVISGTFRIDDESGDSRQSNMQERATFPRGNLSDENFINLPDKSTINRTSSNARSPDFLDSDRFFEPSDFTNSPDFSTLTESDDLDLSPFESVSNSLKKDGDKSVKINQNTSAKQIDSSASIDLKQKIMKRFGTNSQPYGAIPVSNSRVTTRHGLLRQSSARNLPLQNSQISALLSSDSTATHSSDTSASGNRGHLHRSASAGHTSHFPNSQNNLSHGTVYQQNSQNKRWSGFQISGTDFGNSLDTLGYESKSYSGKSDHFTQGLSKNTGSSVSLGNGSNAFNKDNIENQMKSDMFPEFDVSPNKPAISPNNFGNSSAGAFPGVNPNSFSPRQFIQNFQEKSDYSSFGQSFLGTFPQTSSYASNVSSSSLKSNVSTDGPYSLDTNVTPDVNKRHLQGIYSGRSDIVQNTPFYLSGIDDSIKDLAGSDKDETTALLSNFDQF
ncbi:uncharacterized protein LOC123527251 [Mercenaria mercenaria]|uniref:uncharacterized protein LOC123527251 n=1 Tax=Mercenaria mercenaria TaxID=6596 RepID=UPI00234EB8EE|nr:uncharacterized protein LOC123527251 [Mercenaria mercenaria]XP_045162531.2 uncharacterized protein LOC123527251 [Mercenaria mercenaria]